MTLGAMETAGNLGEWRPWRIEFLIGAIPALLTLLIRRRLKEPERWLEIRANLKPGEKLGSMAELWHNRLLRRNALVGLVMATSGVVGLWAIGFFGFGLTRVVLRGVFEAEGFSGQVLEGKLTWWTAIYGLMLNSGGFFGIYTFSRITHSIGRKSAFAIAFVLALLTTAFTFWNLHQVSDIFWMVPLMGFSQLSLFGGYAIYFPELFPTRLRSTGTSFCYNVGRYLAAPGPLLLGTLTSYVFGGHGEVLSFRYAGVTMCVFFLLGLAVLPWAPETKGRPLPD
jgi:MFS family permease